MFKNYCYNQPHPYEELHNFLMQAFEILLKAGKNTSFENVVQQFDPQFQQLVNAERNNKSDLLYKPMKEIYNLIQSGAAADKQLLLDALVRNNKVEDICSSTNEQLITYDDIGNKELRKKLREFLNKLYEVYFRRAAFIRFATAKAEALGWPKGIVVDLKHHFDGLVTKSAMQVCPFCGLNHLQNRFNNGRNAYDHYLPKGNIPFVSINFWNLVPMCDDCNSKNKGEKVPVFTNGTDAKQRVKAFYPFADEAPDMKVRFTTVTAGKAFFEMGPKDINMHIDSQFKEEVSSWLAIFGIETRYKAKVLGDLKTWLNALFTQYRIQKKAFAGVTWPTMIKAVMDTYEESWYNDHNFLKYALFRYLLDEHDFMKYLEEYEEFEKANNPGGG